MMITGFAHVCFTVADLDRAEAFYVQSLGMKKAFDFLDDAGQRYGVYLKAGPRQFVELFKGDVTAPGDRQSYRHICLEVDSLEATVDSLRRAGVEVSEPKMGLDHSWQAWLKDPDGNPIELHEYTAGSWQAPHVE